VPCCFEYGLLRAGLIPQKPGVFDLIAPPFC
jgi:hypothetical protein